jgi:poly-gamma-glutamate capsule biosynthesis protein CapA/YwtB (metallophosphatase superfamily)
VAPLFAAAHLSSLNLETVVGDFAAEEAYPGKRFLLQSPPETMSLLDELGVDLVTLGNNHARDWLDPGVEATVAVIDAAGPARTGAGPDEASAREPAVIDLSATAGAPKIGFLSYTTVNGDFVNDSLPDADDPVPSPLSASEEWQYEERSFGYSGASVTIPTEARRIGAFWRLFEDAEPAIASDAEVADLWARAVEVYPELQDWVARRGHGGANPYSSSAVEADIDLLRADGCDYVVVQFHGGFQFSEARSETLESASHQAIDFGADLVVCHHPHVLQGFEYYDGKLIAYSLGNFVFDQDFLATFPSAVLRVVLEGDSVLETRIYPVALDRYRPVPVGGSAATGFLRLLHERSALPLRSERIDGAVRSILRSRADGALPARLVIDGNSATIEPGPAPTEVTIASAEPGGTAALDSRRLVRSRSGGGSAIEGLLFGRDLLCAGDFEDLAADGESAGGLFWDLPLGSSSKKAEVVTGAPSGSRCLRLWRSRVSTSRVLARPVARIQLTQHRAWEESGDTAVAADGDPTYTIELSARRSGPGRPLLRLDVFHFDDANPTEDPESFLLRSPELALDVPADDAWHEIRIDVPAGILAAVGSFEANAILLYVALEPSSVGTSFLRVDDLRFVEWRKTSELPDGYWAIDFVRSEDGSAFDAALAVTEH